MSRDLRIGHVRTSFRVLRRSEEHTSELQSRSDLVCRLLLEKKKKNDRPRHHSPDHAPPRTKLPPHAHKQSKCATHKKPEIPVPATHGSRDTSRSVHPSTNTH